MFPRAVTVAFFALAAFSMATLGAKQTPSPEATIRAFVAAVQKGDAKAAAGCVKGGKFDPQAPAFLSPFKSGQARIEIKSIKARVNGDSAMVEVRTSSSYAVNRGVQEELETVRVDWVKSMWLLVPTPHEQRRARPGPIQSLMMILSEGMSRIFADAKERAKSSQAMSHIKQLGIATIMLSADYDDKIATTTAKWHKSIFPYVKNENIFRAPGDPKKGDSFNLNPAMANRSMTAIEEPAKTVMIYQGRNGKLEFYNDGRAAVAFCDSSAKLVTPAEAKKLRWKP